jgi:uncharacterized protein YceH (UPF0502 family)
MDMVLDDAEVRILGCLIEKELTTPEYYPLSLNALTNACNQKSNRDPVVSYDEKAVVRALDGLQEKGLARKTNAPGSRVPKYLHTVLDQFDLATEEMAVLCELMLRGPQTVGEIRTRAERMSAFENLEAVERALQGLMDHAPPLAVKLPRETGRKECRHMHLFSGGTGTEDTVYEGSAGPPATGVPTRERIIRLEEEIARLGAELEGLKRAFTDFKSQF